MTICPICSSSLLRQVSSKQLIWFCPNCRQEMPYLDSVGLVDSRKGLLQEIETRLNQTGIDFVHPPESRIAADLLLKNRLFAIEDLIEEGKQRVNVVNFMISNTSSITTNAIVDVVDRTSENLTAHPDEIDLNEQIRFCTRNAEIILCYVCYAILSRNAAILDSHYLNRLETAYLSLKISFEQIIRLVNLMKASVSSFLKYQTTKNVSNNTKILDCGLEEEILNYFDVVIMLLGQTKQV